MLLETGATACFGSTQLAHRKAHLYPDCLGAGGWQGAVLCQDSKASGAQGAEIIGEEVDVRGDSCPRPSAWRCPNLDASQADGLLKADL